MNARFPKHYCGADTLETDMAFYSDFIRAVDLSAADLLALYHAESVHDLSLLFTPPATSVPVEVNHRPLAQ